MPVLIIVLGLTSQAAYSATTQPSTAATVMLGYDTGPLNEVDATPVAQLSDTLRNKMIPLLIYAPKVDRPCPVIIFSHGSGSAGNAYSALLQFWASHGYVCIAPTHAESQSLQDPQMRGFRGSMNDAKVSSSNWGDRVRDMIVTIDQLNRLQEFYPTLKDKIDVAHVGVTGHAFGAYTAQLVGGATIKLGPGTTQQSLRDKRVQALLLLEGQGADQQGLTKSSWEQLELPLMAITGDDERGMKTRGTEWKLQPFALSPAGDKYGAIIAGANHFSFSGRLVGQGEANGKVSDQARAYEDVKVLSLAFWDAYLKESKEARTYLQSDEIGNASNGNVQLRRR